MKEAKTLFVCLSAMATKINSLLLDKIKESNFQERENVVQTLPISDQVYTFFFPLKQSRLLNDC